MITIETPNPGTTPQRSTSFSWLMGGGFISMLGDQFTIIGLPWLTLKVSGDPMALGFVLALIGVPRAIFILLGGAIVDKYSPKAVMLVSKYVNTLLLGFLAYLVYTGALTMPVLYGLAVAIGLASAFAIPAGSSILPFVVPKAKLQRANGLMMGMRQITMFLGPLTAGLVIAHFGTEQVGGAETLEDMAGLALVFALDAFSFLLSALMLYPVRTHAEAAKPNTGGARVFALLTDGLRSAYKDQDLRNMLVYFGLIQLFIGGPLQVGMPVFAETRLDGGAASFGTLMAANGIGMLVGLALSGLGFAPRWPSIGWMILSVDCVLGANLAIFGQVESTAIGTVFMVIAGVIQGIVQVKFFAWLQGRTPSDQMGRVMSLFMFVIMGMAPVSASLAGWLLKQTDVPTFFALCGLTLCLAAGAAMFAPSLRGIGAGAGGRQAQ